MRRILLIFILTLFITTIPALAQDDCTAGAASDYIQWARDAAGDDDYALLLYTCVVVLNPADGEAYHARIDIYNRRGEFELVIADATRLLQLFPGDAGVYLTRGNAHGALRHHDLAMADYEHVIDLVPDWSGGYIGLGNMAGGQGNHRQAIEYYSQGIDVDPTALGYNNRGWAYMQLREYENALADYTRAIELDPAYALAYYNRARTYNEMDDEDSAFADFENTIIVQPDYVDAYIMLGNMSGGRDDYQTALDYYTQALSYQPDNALALNNRGNAYRDMGEYDLARQDYEAALAIDPDYVHPYLGLGDVAYAQGDFEAALEYYRRHAELAGDGTSAYVRHRIYELETPLVRRMLDSATYLLIFIVTFLIGLLFRRFDKSKRKRSTMQAWLAAVGSKRKRKGKPTDDSTDWMDSLDDDGPIQPL